MKKVVVGISGGVDSAVTAYLLKQQGYTVLGVYMRQLDKPAEETAASQVCAYLEIPLQIVDYRVVFQEKVIKRYQQERQGDVTPNPCLWCNPLVKFKCLLDFADSIGATYVATGHYVQIKNEQLCRGIDPQKDQSYFLANLQPEQLARIICPLGTMQKTAVRQLAAQIGLVVADKPDSTDICFPVINTGYTIGQGIKQGGQPEKLYYLGNGKIGSATAPELYRREVLVKNFNYLIPFDADYSCTGKVRSRQVDAPCVAKPLANGLLQITFVTPVRAVTPGQWCVLYDGEIVIGGGEIV